MNLLRLRFLAALALGVLGATSCGDDAAPAGTPAAPPPAKKKEAAPPPPAETAPTVAYMYSPIGKRDPFRAPFTVEASRGPERAEDTVCAEPLCQFDLNDLKVVAVVSGDANPLAMLEDKLGVGHIARRNTKIGRQGGKVTQVLRDCIVVTSFVTGPDGKAQPNKETMCVQADVRSAPVMDLLQGKLRQ